MGNTLGFTYVWTVVAAMFPMFFVRGGAGVDDDGSTGVQGGAVESDDRLAYLGRLEPLPKPRTNVLDAFNDDIVLCLVGVPVVVLPGESQPLRLPLGVLSQQLRLDDDVGAPDAPKLFGLIHVTDDRHGSTLPGLIGTIMRIERSNEAAVVGVGCGRFRVESLCAATGQPRAGGPELLRAHCTVLRDFERMPLRIGRMPVTSWTGGAVKSADRLHLTRVLLSLLRRLGLQRNDTQLMSAVTDTSQSAAATRLSFRVASLLSLTGEMRQELLAAPNEIWRLRRLIAFLCQEMSHPLACKACRAPLAPALSVFAMTSGGRVVSNHVNPHGFVHQVLTVRDLVDDSAVLVVGPAHTRDSYFAGYSWTLALCGRCNEHLGWRFDLVPPAAGVAAENEASLIRFFGFLRPSVS